MCVYGDKYIFLKKYSRYIDIIFWLCYTELELWVYWRYMTISGNNSRYLQKEILTLFKIQIIWKEK